MDDYVPLAEELKSAKRSHKWYYKHRDKPGFPVGKNLHGRIYLKRGSIFAYIDTMPDNLPTPAPVAPIKRGPGRPRKYAA